MASLLHGDLIIRILLQEDEGLVVVFLLTHSLLGVYFICKMKLLFPGTVELIWRIVCWVPLALSY